MTVVALIKYDCADDPSVQIVCDSASQQLPIYTHASASAAAPPCAYQQNFS